MATPREVSQLASASISRLYDLAREAGFPICGIVDLDLTTEFATHLKRYDEWLAAGYSGSMEYLVRGRDRRADPRLVFPTAESVFAVGFPYSAKPFGSLDPAEGPRLARYLREGDYHHEVKGRLDQVLEKFKRESADQDFSWKTCVDTSSVLERTWGYFGGLGWIGKNTLLIHPQLGSYFFIGIALLNVKSGRAPQPLKNYCGSCRRCLDGCPTQAFTSPGVLDSRRCISYLTLEHRGDAPASEDPLRSQIGTWIAGCDVCQEVCPFNRKMTRHNDKKVTEDGIDLMWDELVRETADQYRDRVKSSSLSRVKHPAARRNLIVAIENAKMAITDNTKREKLGTLVESVIHAITHKKPL